MFMFFYSVCIYTNVSIHSISVQVVQFWTHTHTHTQKDTLPRLSWPYTLRLLWVEEAIFFMFDALCHIASMFKTFRHSDIQRTSWRCPIVQRYLGYFLDVFWICMLYGITRKLFIFGLRAHEYFSSGHHKLRYITLYYILRNFNYVLLYA